MSVQEPTQLPAGGLEYSRGLKAYEYGNLDDAIGEFQQCLNADNDPRIVRLAKNYLAESYARRGARAQLPEQYEQAVSDYTAAIALAPRYPDYHFGLAKVYLSCAHLEKHEAALARALELHPKYVDALLALAACQYRRDPEQALRSFELACGSSEELYGYAYRLIFDQHRAGNADGVIATLRSITETAPVQANQLLECATEYSNQEKFPEAEAAFRRAIELAPRFADIRCKFGQLLLRLDRNEEASAELSLAVDINPRYVEALTYLGISLIRLGRLSEGSEFLVRALEIDPLYPTASAELAQISVRRSSK